jgi:hypothetical protein
VGARHDVGPDTVGQLVRADGATATLKRVSGGGDATLDDIILGYFATIGEAAS